MRKAQKSKRDGRMLLLEANMDGDIADLGPGPL